MPGTILKKIRLQHNYTQEACAKVLGISQAAYHKIENNESELKLKHCKQLSAFYNVNIYDFFNENLVLKKPTK